jgi:glycine/D-amino acid oxidase-like deaminating enzyme
MEEICAYSMDLYDHLESSGYECGLVKSGVITVACSPTEVSMLKSEHSALLQSGYTSEYLSNMSDIIRVEPALHGTSASAALHAPLGAYIDPMQATVSVANAAMDAGVAIHEHQDVKCIFRLGPFGTMDSSSSINAGNSIGESRFNHRRYGIVTTGGDLYTTSNVVVASGISLSDMLHGLGLHVPVYPVKGTMFETYFPDGGDDSSDGSTNMSSSTRKSAGVTADGLVQKGTTPSPIIKKIIYVAESQQAWQSGMQPTKDIAAGGPSNCTHNSHGERLVSTVHCAMNALIYRAIC